MKKHLLFFFSLAMPFIQGFTQPPALSIGDPVPNIYLGSMTNYTKAAAPFSELHQELVILDFWNSQCSSCIALFPHLDSLQRGFTGRLQIILVNTRSRQAGDSLKKINHIINKVRQRTGTPLHLPVVYNNDSLDRLFPSNLLPHEVWIYQGKIIAITGASAVNAPNIKKVLAGESVHFTTKVNISDWNYRQKIFDGLYPAFNERIIHRSLFSQHIPGIPITSGTRSDSAGITGKYFYNYSLCDLTRAAYNSIIDVPINRIIIQSTNPYFTISPSHQQYDQHTYCYENTTLPTKESVIDSIFQDDLQRYYGISVRVDTSLLKTWIVHSKGWIQRTKDSILQIDLEAETLHKYIRGAKLSDIVRLLNLYTAVPVVNELPDDLLVSIELPKDVNDFAAMQHAFRQQGLTLTASTRPLKIIIISDGTR